MYILYIKCNPPKWLEGVTVFAAAEIQSYLVAGVNVKPC